MREGIAGIWQGTLEVGVKLRIVFHINAADDGKLTGTLDSPDQGAKGIKIDKVEFTDGALRLSIKAIAGAFEGKLDESTGKIAGKWSQGGASLPLVLEAVDKPPELHRPQEPKRPYPYDEEEVTYENAAAGVKLAGTLTLPRAGGPFAAVLLITGSGAQDRDESLLGHKPFLVLADYLTRRGIAVLRVDDRGVGGSTGNLNEATTEDLAGDALAGVALLKSRKDIDPRRIGLVGHSEGGLIAPLAAIRGDDVAFIVLIAGPGTTGEEILYAQGALIGRAGGATDEAVATQRKIQERMFAVVKEVDRAQREKPAEKPDIAAAEKQLADILVEATADLPDEQKKAAGDAQALAQAQSKQVLTPWFRYFLVYDPRPTLAKIRCPVLAVIGERDLQVPPKENLPEIEKALTSGGNKDFTLRELPGLNHLLQPCKTGSPAEYGQIEETMSPAALELIGDWIVKRSGGK
ncbi:MAG: alpha/beta hydrolase [Planctomycetia bacterium]|nr:alpha/beta hydrolase [Planctomycetia bacterium]